MMATATAEELLEFLIDSARYGDTDDVRIALQEKVAVDGQDSAGRTGVSTSMAQVTITAADQSPFIPLPCECCP